MAKTLDPEEINWVQTGFEKQAIQEFVQEVRAAVFRELECASRVLFGLSPFLVYCGERSDRLLDVENKTAKRRV